MMGNARNAMIEFIMSDEYLRFAVSTYDKGTINMISLNMECAINDAIEYIRREEPTILLDASKSIAGFKTIKNR